MQDLLAAYEVVNRAHAWLLASPCKYKIIAKITNNMGDSTQIIPIYKHYKAKYHDLAFAFLTAQNNHSVHEHNGYEIFCLPNKLNPQVRIKLGERIRNLTGLTHSLCPAIFPFAQVWPSHKWSLPIISHQFYHNAGIDVNAMLGDKMLSVTTTADDENFARQFINGRKCVGLEYHSYSHPVPWQTSKFSQFVRLIKQHGYEAISFCGPNEGIIPGTISAQGMSYRRTSAVLGHCVGMLGIGSGITMLAAAARPQPLIFEIGVSEAISMKACGFSNNAMRIDGKATPEEVSKLVIDSLKLNQGKV